MQYVSVTLQIKCITVHCCGKIEAHIAYEYYSAHILCHVKDRENLFAKY